MSDLLMSPARLRQSGGDLKQRAMSCELSIPFKFMVHSINPNSQFLIPYS